MLIVYLSKLVFAKTCTTRARVVLTSFGVFFTCFFLPVANAPHAEEIKRDLQSVMQDTQRLIQTEKRLLMVWWVPTEYWQFFARDSDGRPAADDLDRIFRDYFVVVIVDATIDGDQVQSRNEDEIRKKITLIDRKGRRHKPLKPDSIELQTKTVLAGMKPTLASFAGQFGQGMTFVLFSAFDSEDTRIAEVTKPGAFTLKFEEDTFNWRLPLGSFVPSKKCPKDGELMSGAWIYCPWHGDALVTNDGDNGTPKK